MKIVIIGAGIGGLQAAKAFSDGGAEVFVYESKSRDCVGYDWIDDVETKVFDELGITLPEGQFFRTANVSFGVPNSDKVLRVVLDEQKLDWSIERRPFSEMLIKRAEDAGAKLFFNTAVSSLIVEDDVIKGVSVNGDKVYADLVVDSSGMYSPFRASLPVRMKLPSMPKRDEVFRVYRAFYNYRKGVPMPVDKKKIYLKHLGEEGIAWCVVEPNGDANVLVGRIGEMSQSTLDNALNKLRETDPVIGDAVLRGDLMCSIPVRYPASRMVCDNYALIGDSAFMTIPMIGSGIANSLRAGQILADTVLKAQKTDISTLWRYQYRYFTEIGASHVSVDKIKRFLLSADVDDVRFLFDSGIIGDKEMTTVASGEQMSMGPKQILDKLKRGRSRLGLLLRLVGTITDGQKAEKCARKIPSVFDESAVTKWQKELDGMFNN